MQFVEKLSPYDVPGSCIFYANRRADPKGFVVGDPIDARGHAGDIRPAVSIEMLRLAAQRYGGMVPAGELDAARQEADELRRRIDELEQENQNLEERFNAIEVFESAGFRARKKTGPKPKATTRPATS